jgi:drug/metabolite transporter (DMT)-like permease
MRDADAESMKLWEWVLLIMLSVLWGGAFFFSKVALGELPPFTVVWGRVTIAAIALNLIVRLTGERLPSSPKAWLPFFGMGLLNNLIPFSLTFWGQTQIPSSLASILIATTPLWTVLLAHFLTFDERLTLNRLGGVLLGVVGVVVTIGPDTLLGLDLNALAQLAVIGAAVSYAFAGIYGKRFKGSPPIVTAAGQVTGTAVMMIPVAFLVDRPWTLPLPSLTTWGALLGLGVLSTALAYIIYFRLLASVGATNVLLVTFLIPVSALFLGITILGEQLDPRHFFGMAMIGLGLVAMDGRALRAVGSLLPGRRPAAADTRRG